MPQQDRQTQARYAAAMRRAWRHGANDSAGGLDAEKLYWTDKFQQAQFGGHQVTDLQKHNALYEKRRPYFREYYRKNRQRMIKMAMEYQAWIKAKEEKKMKNTAAQELARLAKGKKKTLTKAERKRRAARAAYARSCRKTNARKKD
jgi:hypothetical protein